MAARKIKLLSVNDPHVVDFLDTGVDKNGDSNSQRAALERFLSKRIVVDGKRVAVFMLAEAPQSGVTEAEIKFDETWLQDRAGNWMLGSGDKEWMAVREKRIAAHLAKQESALDQARLVTANNMASGLVSLAKSFASGAQASPGAPTRKAVGQ